MTKYESPNTITEYKILKTDFYEMAKAVKKHLEEGWVLYGFPYSDGQSLYHYQAVVKYECPNYSDGPIR
jgi:hypothetical protein